MRTIHLSIDETQWHGWHSGESITTTCTVTIAEDCNLELQALGDSTYVFQLTLCQDDELEVCPVGNAPAPCHLNGGIDLNGKVETTTLRKGQSLRMATPTMDMGIVWKVTLLNITPQEP